MKQDQKRSRRRALGQVTSETKGPPGIFMEGTGLWNGHHLTQ